MNRIVFDPKLAHVLGFRHGPRAARPPAGNVWDYWQPVSEEYREIAKQTIATYFPDLVPAALRCSQIPRSSQSLACLWPKLVPEIELDRLLGFEFEEMNAWALIDAFPDAYDMTPQRQREVMPDLVDLCGEKFLNVARDIAEEVGMGKVGVMCSHVPYADVGARNARRALGITEDGGWLPGTGFGSGAFVHLAYGFKFAGELGPEPVLMACTYYPVPPAA